MFFKLLIETETMYIIYFLTIYYIRNLNTLHNKLVNIYN